jgi:hypothetical protein
MSGGSKIPTPAWAVPFPEPRATPSKISVDDLLAIMKTGTAGVDYVVVDVRRTDIEVRIVLLSLFFKPIHLNRHSGLDKGRYKPAGPNVLPDTAHALTRLISYSKSNFSLSKFFGPRTPLCWLVSRVLLFP